jgi:hypothetical protein
MLANLETRWLHAEKWLPAPTIVIVSRKFANNAEAAWQPPQAEVFLEGRYYEARNGLIVLADNACDGALAHEFRHHWQYWHGWKYDGNGAGMNLVLPYKQAIVEFFHGSRSEVDALLYEVQKAPRHNRAVEWLEWLRESRRQWNYPKNT